MNKKKLLALLMALVMTLTLVPVTAFAEEGYVASVTIDGVTTKYSDLQTALDDASYAGKDATVDVLEDITLQNDWNPVYLNGYTGDAKNVVVQGNGHSITGLTAPLFFGTWSSTTVKIYNLTVENSTITGVYSSGCGGNVSSAFIGCVSASRGTVLENCTVSSCTFTGGKYSGAFIGYAAGYSKQDDGPVFSDITIKNCTATDNTFTSTGSSGALMGHATGDKWTQVIITGATANGNEITCTASDAAAKEGFLIGTIGEGQTYLNENGGVWIEATESGNTLTNGHYEVGRIGSTGGTCYFTAGGYYTVNPLLTSDLTETQGTLDAVDGYDAVQSGNTWTIAKPATATTYVAQIGEGENAVKYETLQAAVNAVPNDGQEVTITILGDITDGGVGLFKNAKGDIPAATNKNIVFDFGGHTVTIGDPLVGSTGTENQSFHLEDGNTVTLRNGTLVSDKAAMLIQNYCDLTLDNMTVGRTTDKYSYTVSCNNGTINFTNGTVINATSAGYAFDVCVTSYYPDGAHITIDNATINGNIQYDVWGSIPAAGNKASLTITGGTFNGAFVVENALTDIAKNCTSISGGTFDHDPSTYVAQDYEAVYDNDFGTWTVVPEGAVAVVGDKGYTSLEAAFAAAEDGDFINVLANCAGNGIVVPEGKFNGDGLTVFFNGFTYTVDGATVGSTGTETNGFQLLKNNNIYFIDGTITSEKAKILVQNYSNLTLQGMTLTLDNPTYTKAYTLSNNNGDVQILSTTINANSAGGFAFDVCRYASYPSVHVTVGRDPQGDEDSVSVINGNIEIYASKGDAKDGFSLDLQDGTTLSGNIVLDNSVKDLIGTENVSISKNWSVVAAAPAGYKWGDDTKLAKITYVAQIGTTKYETLQAAVNAVPNDGKEVTITILGDITDGGVGLFKNGKGNIPAATNKNIVFDFDGHTVTIGEPLVGSTGTESQSFHLEAGNKVTLKGGTLVSDKAAMLIQNYCDLTLDNMTVGRTTDKYSYTVSCNNGTIQFTNGTVINATSTGYAFDVCVTSYYPDGAHITIDDATINGNIQYDVWGSIPAAGNKASLTITGGTFNGAFVVENALTDIAKNCTSISGGKFSTDPSAYVADGYKAATISDGDYNYQVGKVVANATVTGDSTTSNEATYTVGTVVKDEENKDIVDSETTNMQVAIKGTTDSDANAYADVTTGEENKRPVGAAALIQLASDKVGDIVAAAVEAAGAKATDNMSINVVLVSDAGKETMDSNNSVAKVTYEIHPEAIVYSVEDEQKTVIGSYHITNDQLKENTSFTVTLPVDSSWNGQTINITHTKEDGETETIQVLAANDSVTFTVSEFSEFELEPVSLGGYGSNYVIQSSLILDGYINVAFYVHLDNEVIQTPGTAIVLEQTSHMDTINSKHFTISECVPTSDGSYKFVFPVAAKDMDVKIKLHLYDGNTIIPLTNTNSYKMEDGGVQYAVTDYLANKANSSNQKLSDLVEALYAYHETSRFYFDQRDGKGTYQRSSDHDPEALPNDFDPTPKSVTVGDGFEGLSIQSTSLMLVSETTIRFYFKLASGHNISEYTFRCGEKVLNPQPKGSTYYVEVPPIAAKKLNEQQTVTVTQKSNGSTYTVTYGPFNYIKANANNATDGLNDLVTAIYWYQVKAAAFFPNN